MGGNREKPTGSVGPVIVEPSSAAFEEIRWPKNKEAIEEHVLRVALAAKGRLLPRLYRLAGVPIRNGENDFDFTLPTLAGNHYLDLTEFVPSFQKGNPYASATGWYFAGEMAEKLWDRLHAKDAKYGSSRSLPVHLLAYTTHSQFDLAQDVLDLLTFWYHRRGNAFRSVTYFRPLDSDAGEVVELFPRESFDCATFDETSAQNTCVLLADPSKFVRDDDGSVCVPITGPTFKPRGRVVLLGGTMITGKALAHVENNGLLSLDG